MKRFSLLIACIMMLTIVGAQPSDGLVAYYSFDACDATEDTGSGADGIIMGTAACGCGVLGNGLEFDGNTTVQILGNFDVIFGDDFTISFFFLPDPGSPSTMDLMSKSEVCGIDSTFELRYNPGNRTVSMSLSQHINLSLRNSFSVPATECYHHIAFVRNDRQLFLYYDGVLQSQTAAAAFVEIINDGILTLGGGPCLANGEVAFRGVMDELRMYNRALNSAEVKELNFPIDQIVTPDTILFTGSNLMVRLPVSCATSFQWTPSTGVSNINIAQPILDPVISTVYSVEMDYGFCVARDSIRVTVADSADLDCDKVFFPTGFTPNGDNVNDLWGMSNLVFLGEFESLSVYDRWGGEVFQTGVPGERWDGTFKGDVIMPGLYVYQFTYECGGETRRKTGNVTVIR